MPNYPSSLINGTPPGVRTVDNVDEFFEIKDTVQDTAGAGEYPTDQQIGTAWDMDPTTATLDDLSTVLGNLSDTINDVITAIGDVEGESDNVIGLSANMDALKIYHARDTALHLAFRLKALATEFEKRVDEGDLGTSLYPSGQNRGY